MTYARQQVPENGAVGYTPVRGEKKDMGGNVQEVLWGKKNERGPEGGGPQRTGLEATMLGENSKRMDRIIG